MDNKQKIRYLKQYIELKQELEEAENRFDELRGKMLSAPCQQLSDMPKGSPTTFDKIGSSLAILETIHDKKIDIIKEYINIEEIINQLDDPTQRRLMQLRYIDGLNFEHIAVKLNYTWRHTHRLHSIALENIKMS